MKFAGCAGVATGSILVYAYILMYYTKDRGFRGGGYLKAAGEGAWGAGRQSLKSVWRDPRQRLAGTRLRVIFRIASARGG